MARRVNDVGLHAIAIVRLLNVELGIPVARAVELVRASATESGIGELRTQSGVRIELPPRLRPEIQERLRDAMLEAPSPARGRPPGHT